MLVRPQGAGNVGSVARLMANFGLDDLVIVAPRVDPLAIGSRAMACFATDLLERARVVESIPEAIADCTWTCAASGKTGERRRAEFTPPDAAARAITELSAHPTARVAFLLGPEDLGFTNADLDHCDSIVFIPTHPDAPSMNVAQAATILAYELWLARSAGDAAPRAEPEPAAPAGSPDPDPRHGPATTAEVEGAVEHLRLLLDRIGFFRQTVPEHPVRELRKFITRSRPTHLEIAMLRGICHRSLREMGAAPPARPRRPRGPRRPNTQ